MHEIGKNETAGNVYPAPARGLRRLRDSRLRVRRRRRAAGVRDSAGGAAGVLRGRCYILREKEGRSKGQRPRSKRGGGSLPKGLIGPPQQLPSPPRFTPPEFRSTQLNLCLLSDKKNSTARFS